MNYPPANRTIRPEVPRYVSQKFDDPGLVGVHANEFYFFIEGVVAEPTLPLGDLGVYRALAMALRAFMHG